MNSILNKIKQNGLSFAGKMPICRMDKSGNYILGNGGDWTDGFYVGLFYIAYILSQDIDFLDIAKKYDDFFQLRIQNDETVNKKHNYLKLDHDVGMIFLPVNGLKYKLFHHETDFDTVMKAAKILAQRYNERGCFIRAWDTWSWDSDKEFIEEKKGKVIIDSMMNIPLLFQAAKMSGNSEYHDIAYNHAVTVAKYLVRSDYSTYHSFNFNHETGEPIIGKTIQGYDDSSCWSRGEAWAIYGFALAYKYTGCDDFLNIAKGTCKYFVKHLDSVGMPCWDFSAASEIFAPWDSSAAVIAASGMIELHELTHDDFYLSCAKNILASVERFCLTDKYPKCQPLILHGCIGSAYSKCEPKSIINPYIEQALVYADYFYMECLMKLSDCKIRIF